VVDDPHGVGGVPVIVTKIALISAPYRYTQSVGVARHDAPDVAGHQGPASPEIGGTMDCKIEVILVPVTDVDRAIDFYVEKCGFTLDIQGQPDANVRFVQVTPPTSACSIAFGTGITDMVPGTQNSIQAVVPDVEAARQELVSRGVDASEVQALQWGSFTSFSDPDGNSWTLQQLPPRSSATTGERSARQDS
jgi:catechol 2,3-dioxygenase-like lactoylglutathione lyase family enzyme